MLIKNEKTRIYARPAVKGLTLTPLSATVDVFNTFYWPFKSQLLGMKCMIKHDCV